MNPTDDFWGFYPLVSSIRWAKLTADLLNAPTDRNNPTDFIFEFLSVGFINPLGNKNLFLCMKYYFLLKPPILKSKF